MRAILVASIVGVIFATSLATESEVGGPFDQFKNFKGFQEFFKNFQGGEFFKQFKSSADFFKNIKNPVDFFKNFKGADEFFKNFKNPMDFFKSISGNDFFKKFKLRGDDEGNLQGQSTFKGRPVFPSDKRVCKKQLRNETENGNKVQAYRKKDGDFCKTHCKVTNNSTLEVTTYIYPARVEFLTCGPFAYCLKGDCKSVFDFLKPNRTTTTTTKSPNEIDG